MFASDQEWQGAGLIEIAIEQSKALLRENLTAQGIRAAGVSPAAEQRSYTRIFGRDASICALAMVLCDDTSLTEGAAHGLRSLAAHQAANGQLPKYVDPDRNEADFWYLGCIDSTLWWLIAVQFVQRASPDNAFALSLRSHIEQAIVWLRCQEHQQIYLLQQNEASDWADIMPRSGFVLYTNALWYYVKRLYDLPNKEATRAHFNQVFFPFDGRLAEYRRLRLLAHYARRRAKNHALYLSFVNLATWGEEGDVFGNVLAVLFGLADEARTSQILRAIAKAQDGAAHPVRVTCQPIRNDSPLWRDYMGRHQQNLEYQYHNGGIWPFVGGFWVMALAAAGEKQSARAELARLASANAVNDWEFNEWFHGVSGNPRGMAKQSWNAATFLLACLALTRRIF